MNKYYLSNVEDGFGDWEDFPQEKIAEAIETWTDIATSAIEQEFPGTEVEVGEDVYRKNSENEHPDYELIDDFLGKYWTDWLDQAIQKVA